ncbi:MAG: heme o synthase [Pseudomonadales bacterium]|nr:heme o synthase [Pseudomonadales bacterium]
MTDSSSKTAGWQDYLELTKPKVVLLLMVTAIAGMFLATNPAGMVPIDILIYASVGLSLAMGASAVVNHVVDQRIDMLMARTHNRPVASGKIKPLPALLFAVVLTASSLTILDFFVNRITAVLTFLGVIGYAIIYTLYLKRATPQNIVIGGLAGAIPPLLGWTSVTNSIDPEAFALVLIIFIWTPPHFWALAIHRRDDYAKAEIPMLPVTHGIDFTKTNILYYTILLFITALIPFLIRMSGLIYLVSALILGFVFMAYAIKLKYFPESSTPMKTFGFSITYLFLLFIALLVDHYFLIYLV